MAKKFFKCGDRLGVTPERNFPAEADAVAPDDYLVIQRDCVRANLPVTAQNSLVPNNTGNFPLRRFEMALRKCEFKADLVHGFSVSADTVRLSSLLPLGRPF